MGTYKGHLCKVLNNLAGFLMINSVKQKVIPPFFHYLAIRQAHQPRLFQPVNLLSDVSIPVVSDNSGRYQSYPPGHRRSIDVSPRFALF